MSGNTARKEFNEVDTCIMQELKLIGGDIKWGYLIICLGTTQRARNFKRIVFTS